MRCSAGTYVRALARDLGERLGCGAYLGALTRTASGPFRLEAAHPLELVRSELASGRVEALLLPMDAGLDSIPTVHVTARDRESLERGQIIRLEATPGDAPATEDGPSDGQPLRPADLVRVVDEAGRLVAMAHVRTGRLYPDKVFVTPEA